MALNSRTKILSYDLYLYLAIHILLDIYTLSLLIIINPTAITITEIPAVPTE